MKIEFIVIIAILLLIAVYKILRITEVIKFNKGVGKLKKNVSDTKSTASDRKIEIKKLNLQAELAKWFSFLVSSNGRKNIEYIILRLNIKSKVLDRLLTVDELIGKRFTLFLLGIITLPFGISISFFFYILPAILFYKGIFYIMKLENKIKQEDDIIDSEFSNLFLLMYPQLKKGSKGSIKNVVLSYQNSIKFVSNKRVSNIIGDFTGYLLSNLAVYPDQMAVEKLCDKYHSASIQNFANLASQALQGVDNMETLRSYTDNIVAHEVDRMTERNEKYSRRGGYVINAVYILLFEFAILSVLAKLPSAMF